MTHPTANPQYPVGTPVQGKSKYLPQISIRKNNGLEFNTDAGPCSLADYLGYKTPAQNYSSERPVYLNALPFLAYHRIWDDWYRDSRIQAPLFYRPDNTIGSQILVESAQFCPYVSGGEDAPNILGYRDFIDGTSVMSLRQRNWAKDYFTTASTLPQAGNAATVEFDVDTNNGGTFSIATLRAANSLQKWMERNNLAGYRYSDQIYAQYGIYPSDAIMDRCIYLGRHTQNVYSRSVFQTSPSEVSGHNPLSGQVGSKFSNSQSVGQGSLVDKIRVTEHGYLFVLASIVPHAYYSTGVRRHLTRQVVGDIAFPLLSGMGDQAIYKYELDSNFYNSRLDPTLDNAYNPDTQQEVFGYTDLYAEYKYHDDEIHGLLRDGSTLESFALQRSFDGRVELGSDFLQIPKEYLDQIMSVNVSNSGFTAWYDIYFPYHKVSTLPEYSLPTLADLKHVHTKYISRGGKRL